MQQVLFVTQQFGCVVECDGRCISTTTNFLRSQPGNFVFHIITINASMRLSTSIIVAAIIVEMVMKNIFIFQ